MQNVQVSDRPLFLAHLRGVLRFTIRTVLSLPGRLRADFPRKVVAATGRKHCERYLQSLSFLCGFGFY